MKKALSLFSCVSVLIVTLLSVLWAPSGASTAAAADMPSVEGEWKMVANVRWNFRLTLSQSGGSFSGDMYGLNPGDGTTTPVRGTVSSDGTVEFKRSFGTVQTYRGRLTYNTADNTMTMSGTFTETSSSGTYPWSASKPAPQKKVELELTYPVGKSPKVFTKGWIFGARCVDRSGTGEKDLSSKVTWSGTGSFRPARGDESRPLFNGAGKNSITLTCNVGKEVITKTFDIEAVSPDNYAHLGNHGAAMSDSHGCPRCPHPVSGPIVAGSPKVFIKNLPAARKGDPGVHKVPCCGPNTFVVAEGDPEVLIDGKPAARIGDKTQHCGSTGKITKVSTSDLKPVDYNQAWANYLAKEPNWDLARLRDLAARRKEMKKLPEAEQSKLLEKIQWEKFYIQSVGDEWSDHARYYRGLARVDPTFTEMADWCLKKSKYYDHLISILQGQE